MRTRPVSLAVGFAAATCLWLAWPAVAAEPTRVRFAPLPLEDEKIIREQFIGLISYLEEQAGIRIEWHFYRDYADIIAAFTNAQLDLTYLGPLPYVILRRETPAARPLCCFRDRDGAADYTCSLIAFADDALRPEAVRGLRVGLTQPYSTCGYLGVSAMLHAAGRDLEDDGNQYEYAGSHSAAALGVARGRYDVAGVTTAIARRYAHLNLDAIAESEPYPGFTLVANTATLSDSVANRLERALLELSVDNPAHAKRMSSWGQPLGNGTVAASRCRYESVAATLERLPWPIPGSELPSASRSERGSAAGDDHQRPPALQPHARQTP